MAGLSDLAGRLPKTELHVHIEGTLEPQMMFALAARNGVDLPYADVEEVRAAYRFTNLQSFLDIYYQGAALLRTPDDFYDLMAAYLEKAAGDGVRHAEIFFDPQSHTARGIGFEIFMRGFRDAISDARRRLGISADLILCFLRHLSGEEAVATIMEAEPFLDGVIGVGIDSSERGRPPELFEEAYARARELGLRAVAHAGEEGPPEYVSGALDALGAERIDHGVRSLEDADLVDRLRREQIPLTVCPLSNVALHVVEDMSLHPLSAMMDAGLLVSINSDDPAYFGGYIGDNYRKAQQALGLGEETIIALARNSIESSFLDGPRKTALVEELEAVSAGDEG
ncbi:MAG TPA: adenosine deaminase [Acidimicrobiia bacterium]|nr:adenosine deaminase [Acidimicrobiia bacterium]